MSGVVNALESECDEIVTDAETWELNNPAPGGLSEKVSTPSSSLTLTHVAEFVVDIPQRRHIGEKATTRRCSSRWNPLPYKI